MKKKSNTDKQSGSEVQALSSLYETEEIQCNSDAAYATLASLLTPWTLTVKLPLKEKISRTVWSKSYLL